MGVLSWARAKSIWVLHFNSGGCNGCDIEAVAAFTPRFDAERFGVLLVPSPRHADALLVTGPVTKQIKDRLIRIYEQMPEPKFVIAFGTCACTGGVFKGSYSTCGGVDKVIPVDLYIPGCPPKPEALLNGIAELMRRVRGG
ncbi:MAG: NADH-quinone oxidoreductase subunit B family protein [Candidatus Verstraetearchaeota archaeon]|nr:NADH-quinone oxidoreductase subunit B family protein [Candidatus Verstraetearchaeota archaeon]